MSKLTEARSHVVEVLEDALEEETELTFVFRDGLLLEFFGDDKRNYVGTFPVSEQVTEDTLVLEGTIGIQIYLGWDKSVSKQRVSDPSVIEDIASILRDSFEAHGQASEGFWYLRLDDVRFRPDPTGQITRLEAEVSVVYDNTAIKFG